MVNRCAKSRQAFPSFDDHSPMSALLFCCRVMPTRSLETLLGMSQLVSEFLEEVEEIPP